MTEAAPRIAVPQVEARAWTEPAILAGGGMIADAAQAEAAIWTQSRRDFGEDPRGLRHFLEANPGIKWIQFPSAGIEAYTQANLLDTDHIWTCAKGVYSKPVAEMALALALAGLRNLKTFSTARTWLGESGSFLHGAPVTVFGAGGIGQAIVDLLRPFECQVTIVCRDPARLQTTDRVLPFGSRVEALKGARV
ncbi:MAG TPA: hydroxyacid dehydrogenase, partial [Candidatus Dormibacteraeota bacterium]|nr:hydroxyacid dehydrogenase [Candidatus Dormibacteraeota bacterium]